MEKLIQVLIYTHAFFGGLGLITGAGSIIVKKGSQLHKRMGKIFSYAMVFSSVLSLIVARMPGHENLFLFLIGIFTIYMVLAGNRALTFKSKTKLKADGMDKSISGLMFLASLIMVIIGIIGMLQQISNSVLYLFFGIFGTFMTLRDFHTFKTFRYNRQAWLKSHIGRMVGALIASFTAFIVAGLNISTLAVWMLPTVLGTFYILYWTNKLRQRPAPNFKS